MKYSSRSMRRRRGTDKWEVTLTHKNPLTGKPEPSYHTIEAKTEAQAIKKRDKLIAELNTRGAAFASDITVRELLDKFIEHKEKSGGIESSTVAYYKKDARAICRYMGDMPLRDVTMATVDNWIASMDARGLAPRTIAKPFRMLKQAMKYAMANDLITKNPCDYCKPPKMQRKVVNALSRAERSRMLEITMNRLHIPVNCAVTLALMTGMRRGEICGLRWSDLNDDGSITINRSLGEKSGGVYEKDPKTRESHRTIPLAPWLYARLDAMHKDSQRIAAELGVPFGDPYILGTQEPKSKPYQPTRLTREFKTFREAHGFDCQFHDLRHTFASMLIAQGMDVRTVASYLGHANVAMTLNTYAEVDPDAKRAALGKIQEAFDVDISAIYEQQERESREATYTVAQLEAMLEEARKREGLYNAKAS